MPSSVFTPRFQQLLRRTLNLVGGMGLQVDDTVLPVFNLTDPSAPELYAQRGDRLGWGGALALGGVGAFPQVVLSNPAGSGILCVVQLLLLELFGSSSGIQLTVGTGAGAVSTNSEQLLDLRFRIAGGSGITQSKVSPTTVPVVPAAGILFDVPALGVPIQIPTRIVLAPGTILTATGGASGANNNIRANAFWYERSVEPTELTVSG